MKKTDDVMVPLRLTRDLAEAIDTYWHQRRLMSRAETVRELLTYALEQKLGQPAKATPR